MLHMSASTRAARIVSRELEDAEAGALGNVAWDTTGVNQLLSCLFISAHLLEDGHVRGGRSNDLSTLLVQSSYERFPIVSFDSTDVLDVGSGCEMVALTGLEVRAAGLAHGDIEEVTCRVDTCVESSLGLVNVAVDLATLSEGGVRGHELANMHHHVVLDLQCFNVKPGLSLAEEAFVAGLAATLWVEDAFVEHDDLLTVCCALRGVHAQHAVAT
jgi:hypothetical protein